MKKIFFTSAAVIAIAIAAIASGESSYIHNDSGNTLSFNDSDIDSITLSKVDANGVEHVGYVTQIVHAKDSAYTASIQSVDSITFVAETQEIGEAEISTNQEVDLGLSVNWSAYNLGATSPEMLGDRYAWGEVETKEKFTVENYAFANLRDSVFADLGYNICGTKYDAARKNWGGSWRMPTRNEVDELCEKCTWTWVKFNGVEGFKVTGPNGNSIFLPPSEYDDNYEYYDWENDTTIIVTEHSFYLPTGTFCPIENVSVAPAFKNTNIYCGQASHYGESHYVKTCAWRSLGLFIRPVKGDVPIENASEVGKELLTKVTFYAQQSVYDHAEYGIYLSQCLTTTDSLQTGPYPYKPGWDFLNINRHPQWRRHYVDINSCVHDLIWVSRQTGSPNYELIGRTARLLSTQLTTDAFGDMIHCDSITEANEWISNYRDGENGLGWYRGHKNTKMDTQEAMYKWMFDEADELISMFDDPLTGGSSDNISIPADVDYIYAGNLNNWKGLVYAINARLLLRNIPNVDTSSAKCQEIIDCAQQAIDCWRSGNLLYGEWFGNEPRFNFNGMDVIPYLHEWQYSPWSPAQPCVNSWESRRNLLSHAVPSKFFIEDCLGVVNPGVEATKNGDTSGSGVYQTNNGYGNDPRLALLLVPNVGPISPTNTTSTEHLAIRYLENNIGTSSTVNQAHYPDLYAGAYAKNDGYNSLFTMEELYFIQAEAYYWSGDKTKASELAKEASKYNIQRHLTRFLDDNEGLYPGTGNKTSTTETHQEYDKTRWERMVQAFLENSDNGEGWLTDNPSTTRGKVRSVTVIGNKKFFFDPTDFTLEKLMTQKYIAMYMQPEQWTDMRRYHYSNNLNGYTVNGEIVYPNLRRPYNLYSPHWVDGYTEAEKENLWIQRLNYDPQMEEAYNFIELMRIGAYQNCEWLQKPMIWAEPAGSRTLLTE